MNLRVADFFKNEQVAQFLASGYRWLGKEVQYLRSPLNCPVFSLNGVSELARRISPLAIIGLFIVIGVKKLVSSRVQPPIPPPQPPADGATPLGDSNPLKERFCAESKALIERFNHLPIPSRENREAFERSALQLKDEIRSFKNAYPTLVNEGDCMSIFRAMGRMEVSIPVLVDLAYGIMHVSDNGNCLFQSLGEAVRDLRTHHRLNLEGLWHPDFENDLALRGFIVDQMKQHYETDSTLKEKIDESIEAYLYIKGRNPAFLSEEEKEICSKLQGPEKYKAYFELIRKPKAFGSGAEIYAFSKIFNFCVEIEVRIEGKIRSGFWPVFNEGAPFRIKLIHENGDHFNWEEAEAHR